MKHITLLINFLVFSWCSGAYAQVDIQYKMDLLKKNVENSQSNFNKFKDNLSISVKNFNEATKVVNELRNLKKRAIKDKKRSVANALTYTSVLEKYNEFIAQEQASILKEREASEKLEALVQKLKENMLKREEIIVGYNAEIEKIKTEIVKWREKEKEVALAIEDVDKREVAALEERKVWKDKKTVYRKEAKKWSRELGKAKKTESIFKNLRQ